MKTKITGLLTLPQYEAIRGSREGAFAHTVVDQEQAAVPRVFSSSLSLM